MKALATVLIGMGLLMLVGCGSDSPSGADEAKLKQALSKPPSLSGMAKNAPKGARQDAGKPGASTPPPSAGQ